MFELARKRRPSMLRALDLLGHDYDDMGKLMESLMHFHGASPLASIGSPSFSPSLEVLNKEDRYVASIELPGLSEEDVEVTLNNDDVLIIKGEKKVENKEEKDEYFVSECYYGSFRREVPLPHNIDKEKVEASFNKGVLSIDIPKVIEEKEEETTKKIEIKKK